MLFKSIIPQLSKLARGFRRDRGGNVALTFALAALPITALIGAGIDYSRATSVRTALQAALDSTALMLSKSASSQTSGQLQTSAQNYFNGLFNPPGSSGATITANYTTTGGSQVTVTGSANVSTDFMQIFGYPSITVNGSATTSWGNTRLRVALVLDNTGSMSDSNKITELKTATRNLLTQLQNAATNAADVYVSIIPFVKDVDVGSTNYNASWIYWGNASQDPTQSDQTSWDANNGSCSVGNSNTRSSCIGQGSCSISGKTSSSSCTSAGTCSIAIDTTQTSCQSDHVCSKSQYTSHNACTNNGGTWNAGVWTLGVWTQATWTAANHSTWNGCVMDRGDTSGPNAGNYDTNIAAPAAGTNATLYPAEQYSYCPQAVMGLNNNWSSMTTEVNNMSPNGNTNQAVGLQLGWMSLVGGGPFTVPAIDPTYTYNTVVILLTDGLNTQDRWYTNASQIDARQSLTCTNIKASGITVYTVEVSTDGTPLSTLLQNCASDSTKFFFLTSSSQIVTTFNQIGTNLSQLYIAR